MSRLQFDDAGNLLLFVAHKRCYECGFEWDAPTMVEYPTGHTLPGCCEPCIRKSEATVERLTARIAPMAPVPDLERPRRPYADD